ncbi:hypothetical protein A3731_24500 [Roseovarius sp. HI0049]|nr:hypothetical protein A3731_24500 [Roseovarius sp. HI0049]
MRILTGAMLACLAGVAAAQENAVEIGTGVVLRGLDKVNASVTDIELQSGQSTEYGRLTVSLGECRYPEGDAAGDAFAFLTITDTGSGDEVFSGWMVASSPALNPLEHPRYDVWVLRCKTG